MSSMLLGQDEDGEDLLVSIPLGGPIYVHESVGPLTRVSDFETSVIQELESLKEELSGDSTEPCDEDISVDDLKIITEEELVNRAFEEAFKDGELAIDDSQVAEEHLSPRSDGDGAPDPEHDCLQNSQVDMKAIVACESSDALPIRVSDDNKKSSKKPSRRKKKRMRGSINNNTLNDSYIEKVEQLARIKQKQEEDKATVRLHSLDSRISGCEATAKADKIRALKSASVSTKLLVFEVIEVA